MRDHFLIRNTLIFDGSGEPPRPGDVEIAGGRIVSVARPGAVGSGALPSIDGAGLALCPGFIDIHGHSDMALAHPDAAELLEPFLMQGITTQVIGNCGLGVAPAPPERREALRGLMSLILPSGAVCRWESFAGYLDTLDAVGCPLNVIPLVAHGALRCAVRGAEPGRLDGAQRQSLADRLDEALEAGAFGLSAGLIYPPGSWSDSDELVRLCRRVAVVDGLFTCHVRGSSELAVAAVRELLEIGRRSGVRIQHSHHEAFGPGYWHLARETMGMEERARATGLDVASDVIPYHAVNTTLLAIYPPWALAGGPEKLVGRLQDPSTRERIEREIGDRDARWPPWEDGWAHNLVRAGGWDNIVLLQAASEAHAGWTGRSLTAIAEREGRTPFACAAEVTAASGGSVMARYHSISGAPGDDGVLRDLLSHPRHAVAVDVILKGEGVAHPGGLGAMPRVLGHYARDRAWFGLSEAIRKATSLPASRFRLPDRGRVAPGCAADLVLFDPERIGENATWEHPDRPPTGIASVLVNGRVVVQDGTRVAGRAGRVLRRPGVDGAR